MELTYDNFPKWFEEQQPSIQNELISNDLSPEIVQAALDSKLKKGHSERSLEQFKIDVVYQIFYFAQPKQIQKQLSRDGINGSAKCGQESYKVESNQGDFDAADSKFASSSPEEFVDNRVAEIAEKFDLAYEKAEEIRNWIDDQREKEITKGIVDRMKTLIAVILQEPNLRIAAGGLAFAADLASVNGLRSQRAFSFTIGCTPAAISKSVTKWRELLELPENNHMKSAKARIKYSHAQKENHWRNTRFTASRCKQDFFARRQQSCTQ